jgi:aminoglycoside phosphotransferase (APT) family kinase protein
MGIAQILADQFTCKRCHAAGEWLRIARPALRQNSVVHRMQCARCGDQIVAKVSRGDEPVNGTGRGGENFRREYETLRVLQLSFPADKRYATLEPLGYVEFGGSAMVITRLFAGKDLLHYMRKLDTAGVAEACRAAGGWLRTLHENGDRDAERRKFDTADKLGYLTNRYSAVLRKSSKIWSAYRCLEQESSRIGTSVFRAVQLHGDFKPENMLCDGRRYVGLDVQWLTAGPAVYDLAPFLNHLWLGGRSFGSLASRHYRLAETGFLAGYGYSDDTRILRWAQLYFALCQLGGYRRRGHLTASYAHWKVWPLVRQLVRQLE